MSQPALSKAEPAGLDHVWNQLNQELQGAALQLLVRLALHRVRQPDPNRTPEVYHATPNGKCEDPD